MAVTEINTQDEKELELNCRQFILHRKKQYSTADFEFSISDFERFTIPFVTFGDPIDYLLSNVNYLYGVTPKVGSEYYLGNVTCSVVNFKKNEPVFVNQNKYYSNYEIKRTKIETKINFGKGVIYNITSGLIGYDLCGTLSEQINDCNFLLDFIKHKIINLGAEKGTVISISSINDVSSFQKGLEEIKSVLNDIRDLLLLFNVEPDKLFFKEHSIGNFDIDSKKNIEFLINVFIKKVEIENINETSNIFLLKIANLLLGVLIYRENIKSKYMVFNLFDNLPKINLYAKSLAGKKIIVSPYTLLNCDFLSQADNINFENMIKNIKKFGLDLDHANFGNFLGLELIKVFDQKGKIEFLDYASSLFNWLKGDDELKDICVLNEIQVKMRRKTITQSDIQELDVLHEKYLLEKNQKMLCGISILLENKSDAKKYFNLLTEDGKIEFSGFPIYDLATNMNIL